MNICFYIPYAPKRFFIAITLLSISYSLPSFGETNLLAYGKLSTGEMIQIYEEMEKELLVRFDTQKIEQSRELSKTILTLGHIRSKAGMDKLLANIDIEPDLYREPGSPFDPVGSTTGPSIQKRYIALRTLENTNIVPIERIINEAEGAVPGSKRETLLVLLGYSCHGDAFAQYATERKKTKPSATDWESLYQRYSGYMLQKGGRNNR